MLSIAAAVCSVVYTVGLKVMIDGSIARSGGRIALGAVLVAVLFTLSWLLAVIGGSPVAADRQTNLALDVRIIDWPPRCRRLSILSAPVARTAWTLTSGRRTLAGAPRQLINLFGQALRASG